MATKRQGTFRRNLNDFVGMRDGEFEESKFWTNIGKGVATFLLLAYAPSVVERAEVLTVLLLALIMPEVLKKLITMKYANGEKK